MEVCEVVEMLKEALNDPQHLDASIARIQQAVWQQELTGSPAIKEILRDLAFDLDHYEADPGKRAEDRSFFGEERALAEIEKALRQASEVNQ